MTQASAKPQRELVVERELPVVTQSLEDLQAVREQRMARLRLLWEHRSFLVRATAVGMACSLLLALLIPSRYESSVQLMPPDSQSTNNLALMAAFSGPGAGLGAIASELLGLKSSGALFVGVLKSRTVQDRIVGHFDLKKVYAVRLEENARMKLANNTEVSEDRKSGIIKLVVTDRNPHRAAAIATAYVNELDTLIAQLTTSSAHRERVFLEERLNGVKQDLESAEKEFGQFASKNATLNLQDQSKVMIEAAATLEGQLIAAQSELQGLKQIYTDNNVRVRSTQARIDELRHQIEKMGGKAGTASTGSASASDSLYPSIRQLPILGVPYADLYRRLKVEETVFETLTKEYEMAKVQEAKEIPTVKVLDPAEVPERRSFPPRLLITFLGTIVAIGVGVSWILGTARWNAIDPKDPGKLFALEVYETVRARVPWATPNGSSPTEAKEKTVDGTNGMDGQSDI